MARRLRIHSQSFDDMTATFELVEGSDAPEFTVEITFTETVGLSPYVVFRDEERIGTGLVLVTRPERHQFRGALDVILGRLDPPARLARKR